jgi:DNA-binding transcriptional MerR regulator
VAGRSHLSIGEVLSLLQEEFPDVTISKIRFLESQGLVDPERTPSGYRKFYEPDIERLRWVLRQQRDAFLPLKVIKGRLDEQGELPYGDDEEGAAGAERVLVELVEERLVVEASPAAAFPPGTASEAAPAVPSPEPTSGRQNGAGEPRAEARRPRSETERPAVRRAALTEPLFDAGPAYSGYETASEEPGHAGWRPAPEGPSGPRPATAAKTSSGRASQVPGRGPSGGARTARTSRGTAAVPAPGEDDRSLEELVSEPGIDVETVRDLERFGLITPKFVGSVAYYSPQAAVIAQLASAFARHGVEARHLRAYKGAAEREAGMVQQVIMPLIRQRNPEARQAAAQAVEELSHLGGELRAALLRAALADLH